VTLRRLCDFVYRIEPLTILYLDAKTVLPRALRYGSMRTMGGNSGCGGLGDRPQKRKTEYTKVNGLFCTEISYYDEKSAK